MPFACGSAAVLARYAGVMRGDRLPADERHPAKSSPSDLLRTATLGFVGGLRSVMPLAILAAYLEREGPDIADGGWAIDVLASPGGAFALGLAAIGEVVADKLPFVPSRLEPMPLAGRIVLGGTAGALASLAEGRTSDSGALVGSVGALLGSLAGYALRTNRVVPLPPLVLALGEDALGFTLGRWAVWH
jgi:uncharacterized membrane protein